MLVVARQPQLVLGPFLWAEDGTVWLAAALADGSASTLAAPYAGYLHVLPRAVALVATHVPLRFAPWIFAWTAVAVLLVPVVLLTSERARDTWNAPTRAAIALAILLLPFSAETFANLTNTPWRLGLAALLIFVLPPSQRAAARGLDLTIVTLSAFSGPLALLALPVHALLARRSRWKSALLGASAVGALLQATLLVQSQDRAGAIPDIGRSLLRILGGQIGIGALFGTHAVAYVDARPWATTAWTIALGFLFVLAIAVARSRTPGLRPLATLALLVLVAALVGGTADDPARRLVELGTPPAGGRYWLLPILTIHLTLLALLRDPRTRRAAAIPAALALYAIAADFRHPSYPTSATNRAIAVYEAAEPGAEVRVPLAPPPWEATWRKPAQERGLGR